MAHLPFRLAEADRLSCLRRGALSPLADACVLDQVGCAPEEASSARAASSAAKKSLCDSLNPNTLPLLPTRRFFLWARHLALRSPTSSRDWGGRCQLWSSLSSWAASVMLLLNNRPRLISWKLCLLTRRRPPKAFSPPPSPGAAGAWSWSQVSWCDPVSPPADSRPPQVAHSLPPESPAPAPAPAASSSSQSREPCAGIGDGDRAWCV
mmetsp:Transcript_18501/g.42821  ORF Transcript_18501/g.42821 Transcript_18501/m.42821 type:complete len:208 (-) Transcript_18501:56-679(-)